MVLQHVRAIASDAHAEVWLAKVVAPGIGAELSSVFIAPSLGSLAFPVTTEFNLDLGDAVNGETDLLAGRDGRTELAIKTWVTHLSTPAT